MIPMLLVILEKYEELIKFLACDNHVITSLATDTHMGRSAHLFDLKNCGADDKLHFTFC